MLTVLEMIPEKRRSLPARIYRRFVRPPVNAYIRMVRGKPYVHIICEQQPHRQPDWRMIAAYTLDGAGRVLSPKDIEPPESSGLRRYRPTRFARRLLENMLLDILISSDAPPKKRTLAIYGREREIALFLPRLVPLVGYIRIITRRPDDIYTDVERIIADTGMSICVTSEPDASDCAALLAPSGGASLIDTADGALVFSPDRPKNSSAIHISAAHAYLPPYLEQLGGIFDTDELVGAFYEIGGLAEPTTMSPRCADTSNGTLGAETLARLYSQYLCEGEGSAQ